MHLMAYDGVKTRETKFGIQFTTSTGIKAGDDA
jgi:hypothetical protein